MDKRLFSVIDVETTGFSPKRGDRIIEIGITKIDLEGNKIETFDTLINPNRDVGSTSIHGITAGMVKDAPFFDEIIGDLLKVINGTTMVAHNAIFDIGFMKAELERSQLYIKEIPYNCTLCMARNYLLEIPSKKLEYVCNYFNIINDKAHSAISDSIATAEIFIRMLKKYNLYNKICTNKINIENNDYRKIDKSKLLTREKSNLTRGKGINFLQKVIEMLPTIHSENENEFAYAEKLDEILLDRIITKDEAEDLMEIAMECGITREQAREIHKEYLRNMIRIALIDSTITENELVDINKIIDVLNLGDVNLQKEIDLIRKEDNRKLNLRTDKIIGKSVCFTGELKCRYKNEIITREGAIKIAKDQGMIVMNGVTKKLDYLVAADVNSFSGKTKKAREYGIKILDENAFWNMLGLQIE